MNSLSQQVKERIQWAMRCALLSEFSTKQINKSSLDSAKKFIKEEATFEQLLNLVYNSNRKDKYLSSNILENVSVNSTKLLLNIKESKDQRKKRDGTGPYKTSDQKSKGKKGKRQEAGKKCPNIKMEMVESLIENMKIFKKVEKIKPVQENNQLEKLNFKIPLNSLTLGTASFILFRKCLTENLKKNLNESDSKNNSIKTVIRILKEAKNRCKLDRCQDRYNQQISLWESKLSR